MCLAITCKHGVRYAEFTPRPVNQAGSQGEEAGRRLANGGARQRRRRGKMHTELLDYYVMMGLRELCDYEIMMRGRLCYDRVLRTMRISMLRSERNKD